MAGLFSAANLSILVRGQYLPINSAAVVRDITLLERLNKAGNSGPRSVGGVPGVGGAGAAGGLGVGATVAVGAAAAITGAAIYAGIQANDFERATQRVWANSQLAAKGFKNAQDSLKAYRRELENFSASTGFDPMTANSVFFRGMNAGFSGNYLKNFATAVLKSALPSGSDPQSTALSLASIIRGFHLSTTDPNTPLRTMDLLHGAAATGQIADVGQLVNYFPKVAAIAGAVPTLGGPSQAVIDSLAIFTTLTKLGNPVSQAATLTSSLYSYLVKPSGPGQKMIDQLAYTGTNPAQRNLYRDFSQWGMNNLGPLGILQQLSAAHLTDKQILTIMPGARSGRGLLELLSNGNNNLVQSQAQKLAFRAPGTTEQADKQWLATTNGQLSTMGARIHDIAIVIGGPFNSAFRDAIAWVNPWMAKLAGWVTDNQKSISNVMGFMIRFFGAETGAALALLAFGPVGPFGAIVLGLKTWGAKIKAGIGSAFQGIYNAMPSWGKTMTRRFGSMWDGVIGALESKWGGFTSWLGSHMPSIHIPGFPGGSNGNNIQFANTNDMILGTNGPVPANYLPSRGLFMGGSGSVISSPTAGDQGILPGTIRDVDYGNGAPVPGNNRAVTLPGKGNIKWVLDKVGFVPGMGAYEVFHAQNNPSAKIGFIHLSSVDQLGGRNPLGGGTIGTAYSGGSVVGTSGFPTNPKYGSGAQLCLIYNGPGQAYLAYLDPQQLAQARQNGQTVTTAAGGTMPGNIAQWDASLGNAGQAFSVPSLLAAAIMQKESGGNPNLKSPAGAMGLMQLMPSTIAQLAKMYPGAWWVKRLQKNPYDPQANVYGGEAYFSYLLNKAGGNVPLALEYYNAGPNANQATLNASSGYASSVIGQYNAWGGNQSTAGGQSPPPPPTKPVQTPKQMLANSDIGKHQGWVNASAAKYRVPVKLLEAVILQQFGGQIKSRAWVDWIAWDLNKYFQGTGDWTVALADEVHGSFTSSGDPLAQTAAGNILDMAGTLGLTSLPDRKNTTPPGVRLLQKQAGGLGRLMGSLNSVWSKVKDPSLLPLTGNGGLNQTQYLKDETQYANLWERQHDDLARISFLLGGMSKKQLDQTLALDKMHRTQLVQHAQDALHGGGPSGRIVSVRTVGSCAEVGHANKHRSVTATATQATAKATQSVAKSMIQAVATLDKIYKQGGPANAKAHVIPIVGGNTQAAMRSHGTPTAAHPGS